MILMKLHKVRCLMTWQVVKVIDGVVVSSRVVVIKMRKKAS